jgi:hypothetical protein
MQTRAMRICLMHTARTENKISIDKRKLWLMASIIERRELDATILQKIHCEFAPTRHCKTQDSMSAR